MAKGNIRRMVSYMVCCDCERCQDSSGDPLMILKTQRSIPAARRWLKKEKKYHSSLFLTQEVIKAFDVLPQRNLKTRKAA